MFLCGVRKNICTTTFLDTQELHSWSSLKTNVCIFPYISLKKILFPRRSKVFSGVGGMGGDWINFWRRFTVWTLQNILQFFIWIEIFENLTIFCIWISLFTALKRWNFRDNLDFRGKIATTFLIRLENIFSQYETIWQKKETENKQIYHGAIQTLSLCYSPNFNKKL